MWIWGTRAGDTRFETPVLRLDIQALLVQEMDSIVIVEINVSTTKSVTHTMQSSDCDGWPG